MKVWCKKEDQMREMRKLAGGHELRKMDLPSVGEYYMSSVGDVFSIREKPTMCCVTKQEGKNRESGFFSFTGYGNKSCSGSIRSWMDHLFPELRDESNEADMIDFANYVEPYKNEFSLVCWRVMSRWSLCYDIAYDIVQEAFISSARKFNKSGKDIRFGQYWTREAHFLALNRVTWSQSHPSAELQYDIPVMPEEMKESFRSVKLSNIDRMILDATMNGYEPREIAKILHLTPGNVRSRKHLIVKKIMNR